MPCYWLIDAQLVNSIKSITMTNELAPYALLTDSLQTENVNEISVGEVVYIVQHLLIAP